MTTLAPPPQAPPPAPPEPAPTPAPADHDASARWWSLLDTVLKWVAALVGALTIFSAILLTKGANPLEVYADAWTSTFTQQASLEQIFVKMAPFLLAALAVVVPARAGMVNVGGEGQVIMGAVAAAGVALLVGDRLVGGMTIALMFVAGLAAGALWAGIAGLMRMTVKVNEAVSTLLLNYVALNIMLFLIYSPWKEIKAGQPASRELNAVAKLPWIGSTKVHIGLVIALAAAVAVWFVLKYSTWGFRLAVVGGNQEAARRAGLPVGWLLMSALLVGGALAGLAGMVHFAGVEYKLRGAFGLNIGYIGFLASWLARHRPLPVVIASFAFAAIIVAGDSLQLDSGLPAATVNVLTGLILIAVLGWTGPATHILRRTRVAS